MLTYTVQIRTRDVSAIQSSPCVDRFESFFREVVTNEAVLFTDKTMKEQCMNSDFPYKCVDVCV